MAGKKILITGAAGFIGFGLSQRLLARGDAVVGLDNMKINQVPFSLLKQWERIQ